jgi:L-ascorbate metabolism protein UlaG (beta-lactamase superfamily)
MKRIIFTLLTLAVVGASAQGASAGNMLRSIHWLGHDTFKITGKTLIYTDPFEIKTAHNSDKADLILITHEHRDHCSPLDIQKIIAPDTIIVATADCAKKLELPVTTVKPGDKLTIKGIDIEVVRAYNTNKKFHPRTNDWVGYIFTVEGQRIYLAGDTDHIDEMKDYRCDIALIPVSGTYVMTAAEAVKATLDINPKLAIPMHYGSIVGEPEDAEIYARGLSGKVEVRILDAE